MNDGLNVFYDATAQSTVDVFVCSWRFSWRRIERIWLEKLYI